MMPDSYPAIPADDDHWIGGKAEVDGRPMIIRVRPDLQNFRDRSEFPRKLLVLWEFGDNNPAGMPDQRQNDDMRLFEDAAVPAFDERHAAILAYVLTYHGRREWHFYFSNMELVSQTLNTALSSLPKMPIYVEAGDDPGWGEYLALMNSFV